MQAVFSLFIIGPVCGIFLTAIMFLLIGACYYFGKTETGRRFKIFKLCTQKAEESESECETYENSRVYTPPPAYDSLMRRDSLQVV